MEKPIRENFQNEEDFHEALIEYGKKMALPKKKKLLSFYIDDDVYEEFKKNCESIKMSKRLRFLVSQFNYDCSTSNIKI